MNIDTVKRLFDAKLTVFPCRYKRKEPLGKWGHRTPADNTIEEFNKLPQNIGVVLGAISDGIVDIDLDRLSAVKIAPYFLPNTGWVFGRKTKPNSHHIYRVPMSGSRVDFKSKHIASRLGGKGTVCEYRADGCYTVFPPSLHDETGEDIEFFRFDKIGESTRERLLDALNWIFASSVVAELYKEGSRQDIIMALSGMLLVGGKSPESVRKMVDAICDVTGDKEHKQRLGALEATHAKFQKGESITQYSHLCDLIGTEPVREVAKALRLSIKGEEKKSQRGSFTEDDTSDRGIARLFAKWVKDRLIHVSEAGRFYLYEDGIWKSDDRKNARTLKLFGEFVQEEKNRVRLNTENIDTKRCLEDVKFLLKNDAHKATLNALEQTVPLVRMDIDKLDAHDHLLALRNGVYNLKDGTFEPSRPEHYITQRSKVSYDPKAECPKFKAFLNLIFKDDEDLRRYVQGIMGYMLTGYTDRQEFYILYGVKQNGKSTLMPVIEHILGSLSGGASSSTIFEGDGTDTRAQNDLAQMRGKRLVVAQEKQSRFRLNSPLLKEITGDKTTRVMAKYQNPYDMPVKFKLVIVTNLKPNINFMDEALKRRIRFIPFDYIIPDEMRVKDYDAILLQEEASGILNFILEGTRTYMTGEIQEPQAVKNARDDYFMEQNKVACFLKDRTIQEPGRSVGKGQLYKEYLSWCEDEMEEPYNQRLFKKSMMDLGFDEHRTNSEKQWLGLALMTDLGENIRFFSTKNK